MTWQDPDEPLWRSVAYWLVIITFFSLPLVAALIALTHLASTGELSFLREFHRVLAGLLAAMLGLNSWDKRRNGRH